MGLCCITGYADVIPEEFPEKNQEIADFNGYNRPKPSAPKPNRRQNPIPVQPQVQKNPNTEKKEPSKETTEPKKEDSNSEDILIDGLKE